MGTMKDMPVEPISQDYRIFCRVVCGGLVLIGMLLLVFSVRTSQFTCHRSDGLCTIAHYGLFPGPGQTFKLDRIRYVGVGDNGPSSYNANIFRLIVFEYGGYYGNRWPITYSWVSSTQGFEAAIAEINKFLGHPRLSDLSVQLPDLRINYLVIAIFLLTAGVFFTAVNFNAIRPGRRGAERSLTVSNLAPVDEPSTAQADQSAPAKKRFFRNDFRIWMGWVMLPFFVFLFDSLLGNFLYAKFPLYEFIRFLLLFLILGGPAWVIHDLLNGKGLRWTVFTVGGAIIFVLIYIVFFYRLPNFESWSYVLSQGKMQPSGLAAGLVVGFFQWLVLHKRLAGAAWWILGSGLAGLVSFSIIGLLKWIAALLGQGGTRMPIPQFLDGYSQIIPVFVYFILTCLMLVMLLKLRWNAELRQ
jgi:hypothetical protein